jgi:molybdopterin-binding protein
VARLLANSFSKWGKQKGWDSIWKKRDPAPIYMQIERRVRAQGALQRSRDERRQVLARQLAVRGLALGFEADHIMDALKHELVLRGRAVSPSSRPSVLGHEEPALLTARNRLGGTITSLRVGELIAEITVRIPAVLVVATITRTSLDRLGLEPGIGTSVYVKASELKLGRDAPRQQQGPHAVR